MNLKSILLSFLNNMDLIIKVLIVFSVFVMLLIVGLSVLLACKKGAIKAFLHMLVSLTAFGVSLLVAMPLARLIARLTGKGIVFLASRYSDTALKIIEGIQNIDFLSDFTVIAPSVIMATGLFVFLFLLQKIVGSIVLGSIIKKRERKGSKFFRMKFPCSPLVSVCCGIISGMLLFTIINVQNSRKITYGIKTAEIVRELSDEGDEVYKKADAITKLNKNPARIASEAFGGKLVSDAVTTIKLSDKKVVLYEECLEFFESVKETATLVKKSDESNNAEKAKIIRGIGERISRSDLITNGIADVTQIILELPEKINEIIAENEDIGEINPEPVQEEEDEPERKEILQKEILEELKKTDSETVSKNIITVTETVAFIVENGYFDFSKIKVPKLKMDAFNGILEAEGSFENKEHENDEEVTMEVFMNSLKEEIMRTAEKMGQDYAFGNICRILNRNDNIKRNIPKFLDFAFCIVLEDYVDGENVTEQDICVNRNMSEMSEEAAYRLGCKIDELALNLLNIVNSDKIKEDFSNVSLIEDEDIHSLTNAFEKITKDEFIGKPVTVFVAQIMKNTLGIDFNPEALLNGGSIMGKIEAMRELSGTVSDISDSELSEEEKTERVENFINNVNEENLDDYSALCAPEFVGNLLNVQEESAMQISKVLTSMFNEFAETDNASEGDSKAVKTMISLVNTNSESSMFGENGVSESASDFTNIIMNSDIMKNALISAYYDENGELIENSLDMSNRVSFEDRAEIGNVIFNRMNTTLSEKDMRVLNCLGRMFAVDYL